MSHAEPIDPLLKPTEVARIFSVEPYTVRTWLKTGKIQGVKINNRWRIPESEVRRLAGEKYGDGNGK